MRDAAAAAAAASSTMRGARKSDLLRIERGRREKMSEYYTMLQSMVPGLVPRATRARIIDETIGYMKSLEEAVVALDSQRMAVQLQAQRGSSARVTVSGRTAFFGLRIARRPMAMTRVMEIFDNNRAEVLAATVAGEGGWINATVTALLPGVEVGCATERIKAELLSI